MEELLMEDQEYLNPLAEFASTGGNFDDLIFFQSGELERERIAFRKLGPNGWHRLQLFKDHYSGAWGMGGKRPFSPKSHDALIQFLSSMDFPKGVFPSVFLTDEGYVELIWENANGEEIQVEFGPNEAEYYDVEKENGGVVTNSKLGSLSRSLSNHV